MHVCLQLALLVGLLCLGGHIPAFGETRGRQQFTLYITSAGKVFRAPRILHPYLQKPNEHRVSKRTTQDHDVGQDNKAVGPKQDTSPSCDPCTCREDGTGGLVVDCTGRNLTDIPDSLPARASQILMANNDLRRIENGRFSKFNRLQLLDLSRNAIVSLSNGTFQGISTMMKTLHLHGNRLRYTPDVFTAEVLAPLQSLRHLTLHNNTDNMAEDLDYPHLALSRLPLLEELSLDGLTNRTFGEGFAELTNLKTLTLSGMQGFCDIKTVLNRTFQTLPFLKHLSIVKCGLSKIEREAFLPLQKIDILDISKNFQLGLDEGSNVVFGLQNSSIRVVYANEIYSHFAPCVIVKTEHIRYFSNTHIEELYIDQNDIQIVEKGALLAFSDNLKILSARGNNFKFGLYWFDLLRLNQLEVLYLGMYNETPSLPVNPQEAYDRFSNCHNDENLDEASCSSISEQKSCCYHYKTQKHDVIQSQTERLSTFTFSLPPKLKELSFRGRLLRYNLNPFNFSPNNSLEIFDASMNMIQAWIGPVKNLNKVKLLNLSQTYASEVRPTTFIGFASLETLDISHNFLGEALNRNNSHAVFDPLKSLRHLNVSFNGLHRFPESLFRGLRSLTTLCLQGNNIRSDDFTVDLLGMSNLTFLDLSSNSIETLSAKTCDMIDKVTESRNVSLTLDLRNNPLSCTCGNLVFLRWLHKANVQLVQAEEQQCIYENASHVPLWAGLEKLEDRCGERGLLFAGSAVGFVLLCAVFVGLVLYRYRWKLRYLYYLSRGRYLKEQVAREDFRYDVFLSYATEDYQWVTRQLLPHLEAQGLRACLHQKDFIPGRPIAANIVEAVQTSRRTVCVLSPNFLDSQWCLYEMQMAIMEGVHARRDVLLLLIYEHVGPQALPREVLHYYQSDSYLEYPRDARCLPFFWENLTMALR